MADHRVLGQGLLDRRHRDRLHEAVGLKAIPTATGGPAPTLTQVMSGRSNIGWSAPPFGLDLIDQNKIRVIATGMTPRSSRARPCGC